MNSTYFSNIVLANTEENLEYLIDCGEFELYSKDLSWYDEKYLCICYDGIIDTTEYYPSASVSLITLEEFKKMIDNYEEEY